jgi:hypothetical protein
MSRLCGAAIMMALCAGAAAPAGAQTPEVRVNVGGRVQTQWNSTSVDAEPWSTFETRRARLRVDVEVGDWIRGRVEPELALGRLQLRQAWMSMELDEALVVRAGQYKKPFSMVMLSSSRELPMIERGVRIRGLDAALAADMAAELGALRGDLLVGEQHELLTRQLYAGYELGATLEGRRGGLAWSVGVFNGSGPDRRDENDAKSVAGRASYALDAGVPLTLGAGFSRRELNWPDAASSETRSGNAVELDAQLGGFRRGVWLLAEVSAGDNLVTLERFAGAQVVGSYFAATGGARIEGVEPVARASWGDPDRTVEGDDGVLLTAGVNLYFVGRNRLMFNWDMYRPGGGALDTQYAARAQMNLAF